MSTPHKISLLDSTTQNAAEVPRLGPVDLALLGVSFIWGTNFVIIKASTQQFAPLAFTSLRFLIGAISLIAILLLTRQRLYFSFSEWRYVLGLATVGHIIFQTFFVLGLQLTTAGNSSLIIACSPALVAVFCHFLGWGRLKATAWTGVALSLSGLALIIVGGKGFTLGSKTLLGDALTILAMICWAIYTTMIRPLVSTRSSLVLTATTLSIGSIGLLAIASPSLLAQDWRKISETAWLGLVYSGFLVIGLGYFVWGTGVKKLGGARTSLYSNLITIFAVLAGVVFLNEAFSFRLAVGAALVLVGTALTRLRE